MEKSNMDSFPQADNIEKIFKIINMSNPDDLLNESAMSVVLGDISGRQVRYYVHAAQYLGVLDKAKKFTAEGEKLRKSNLFEQRISIAQRIMVFPAFSEVYFTELILGVKLEKNEVVMVMKKHIQLSSEVMYRRRAQTIMRWIEWIHSIDELHTN